MRLDKYTLRGQEAIQSAVELAEKNQHQQVEPEHLLVAMLEQPEGIVRPILGKLGANVAVILNDTQAAVARFPRSRLRRALPAPGDRIREKPAIRIACPPRSRRNTVLRPAPTPRA